MINWPSLMLWLVAGLLSGAFFFLGLQHTVHKAITSKQPGRLFVSSFLLRFALVIPIFVLAARQDPLALLLCFLGFMLSRQAVLRKVRKAEAEQQLAS